MLFLRLSCEILIILFLNLNLFIKHVTARVQSLRVILTKLPLRVNYA